MEWAMSWENLSYVNNSGADQPAHPHSLISPFVICCLGSIISLISFFAISRFSLACVAEQASLESYLVENPEDRFSHDEAQIFHFRLWNCQQFKNVWARILVTLMNQRWRLRLHQIRILSHHKAWRSCRRKYRRASLPHRVSWSRSTAATCSIFKCRRMVSCQRQMDCR